jgi:alpha-beta hydrolase superfamily lysophospholipase
MDAAVTVVVTLGGKMRNDAGLADEYWVRYFTPEEVETIRSSSETTMIISGGLPIHLRLYVHNPSAPTVLMAHGLITYGLSLARLQLPFYRAGFNVVQMDMPGFGQSGGPRGGCTIEQIIAAWKDAMTWTEANFSGPIYTAGFGEDGTTCYYALANHPGVRAMSFHNLWQYGDTDTMPWQGGPWLLALKRSYLAVAHRIWPTYSVEMHEAVPWDDLFGPEGRWPFRETFENDPLRNHGFQYPLVYSMLRKRDVPVRFEECRTPIQIIASDRNRLWHYNVNLRAYRRLGCEKELVTLEGKPQWEFTLEFEEAYCAHAIEWFRKQGAAVTDDRPAA